MTDVHRAKRTLYFWRFNDEGGHCSRRLARTRDERLSHVYLPLYPDIFKGISLAVPVGGSKYLIFSLVKSFI